MPAVSAALDLFNRSSSAQVANATANATAPTLHVICAWPVSGQYGPGSRFLYYILVAACIFARKQEWLRNACLAAALLVPAVAALHGIVLAALPFDGAVDMDVFGAFQLCSIGILAAPVTVRLSSTYFNMHPGRNVIFAWTGLILAGLLSLTVEFFRIQPTSCPSDIAGVSLSPDPADFPYNTTMACGLNCCIGPGCPFNPMRQGSSNNIYLIPDPQALTFGTATLLAAACCIPAILSLASMWNKILDINWKLRFGNAQPQEQNSDETIEGTNGATVAHMTSINDMVKRWLSTVELFVFGAAVLLILVLGEKNFFSKQVDYQTEPIQSIGQWAPLVGAALAVLGSLYMWAASEPEDETEGDKSEGRGRRATHSQSPISSTTGLGIFSTSAHSVVSPPPSATLMRSNSSRSGGGGDASLEKFPTLSTTTHHTNTTRQHNPHSTTPASDIGGRRRFTAALTELSNALSNSAHIDESEFKLGAAVGFPEIPGEVNRNPELRRTIEHYKEITDENELRRASSRAGSFISATSASPSEEISTPRVSTTMPPDVASSSLPTLSSKRAQTPPVGATRASSEQQIPQASDLSGIKSRLRRDTLEVPLADHHSIPRSVPSPPLPVSMLAKSEDQASPSIIVSSEAEMVPSPPTTPDLYIHEPPPG